MEDLKKQNELEEKLKEDGGTPTPSHQDMDDSISEQEDDGQQGTPDDNNNSDLTLEDLDKELQEDDEPVVNDEALEKEEETSPQQPIDDENSNPSDTTQKAQEKLLTQSQVNELVGKARKEGRESAMKDLLVRYGVNDENELNDMFGRGQAYDDLDYDYQNQGKSFKDAMAENALLKSHISEDRWDDVKLILSGKGLEINAENIAALLPTHPEWNGNAMNNPILQQRQILTEDMAQGMVDNEYQNAANQIGSKKPAMLKKLGNEPNPPKEKSEEEMAAELYGW